MTDDTKYQIILGDGSLLLPLHDTKEDAWHRIERMLTMSPADKPEQRWADAWVAEAYDHPEIPDGKDPGVVNSENAVVDAPRAPLITYYIEYRDEPANGKVTADRLDVMPGVIFFAANDQLVLAVPLDRIKSFYPTMTPEEQQ